MLKWGFKKIKNLFEKIPLKKIPLKKIPLKKIPLKKIPLKKRLEKNLFWVEILFRRDYFEKIFFREEIL